MTVAKVIGVSDPHAAWATMNVRTILNILLYGVVVGFITFLLYLLLSHFVFEPILCRDSVALARCETKDGFASGVAIVLGAIVGLVFLVRERVYRPILAIIGVCVSLWGIFALLALLPVVLAGIVAVILFSLSYVLFSWLVQPTSLAISVVGVVVVAVLARMAVG
jgi:hypothetical protein